MNYKPSDSLVRIDITCSHCGTTRSVNVPFNTPWPQIAERIEDELGWLVNYRTPLNVTFSCDLCTDETDRRHRRHPDFFDDPAMNYPQTPNFYEESLPF